MTAGSISGTFANVTVPQLLGDLIFVVSYDLGAVTLSVEHGSPMMVCAECPIGAGQNTSISPSVLHSLINEAISRWSIAGANTNQRTALENLQVRIADLPPGYLGFNSGDVIWIDQDAAGYGWFVDMTPGLDEEFVARFDGNEEIALTDSPASGRIDLLTVLGHEIGHVLGFEHGDPAGVMGENLAPGVRRLVWPRLVTDWPEAVDLVLSEWPNGELIALR